MMFEYYVAVVFLLNPGAAPLPLSPAKDKIECQKIIGQKLVQPQAQEFLARPDVKEAGGVMACLKIELPSV
jgi:hypothetical protein